MGGYRKATHSGSLATQPLLARGKALDLPGISSSAAVGASQECHSTFNYEGMETCLPNPQVEGGRDPPALVFDAHAIVLPAAPRDPLDPDEYQELKLYAETRGVHNIQDLLHGESWCSSQEFAN
jgi:hypothetical protein